MEKNLTTGSVPKTMAYFALPYLLSYFLQTLYGMADLFIIGQFCGNDAGATTAVANGSQVMHMLTVILVGLAMGTTVVIGKAVGAKKLQDARCHRKYSHHLHDNISSTYSNAAHFYKSNSCGHGYTQGGCKRNHRLPDSLLYRNSIYNSIQRDKFHIQGTRRFQKSNVLHRGCMRP